MEQTAQNKKKQILITNAATYIGAELASYLLSKNYQVWGVGRSHIKDELVLNDNFTLLDLNLAQPLPEHLPPFDVIVHISLEIGIQSLNISPITNNFLTLAHTTKSKLLIVLPIKTDTGVFEHVIKENLRDKIKIVLIGDLYGPQDPNIKTPHFELPLSINQNENDLENIITQAISKDKIILEKDGTVNIYPTFIKDAVHSLERIISSDDHKLVHYIISENHKTTLSASYEIQNLTRLILSKDLGLFFSGPPQDSSEMETAVKVPENENIIKTKFDQGIKETLLYFKEKGLVKNEQPSPVRTTQITNFDKFIDRKIQQTQSTKSRNKTFKPVLFESKNLKKIIITAFVIIFLTIAKTVLDLFLATQDLKQTQQLFLTQKFDPATHKAQLAAANFHAASNKIKIISWPFKYIIPQTVISLNSTLQAAEDSANALSYFSQGAKSLMSNLAQITAQSANTASIDIETPSVNFQKAFFSFERAQSLLSIGEKSNILKPKLKSSLSRIQKLNQMSQVSNEFTVLVPQITGSTDSKTYLILLNNNTELRPGGGFIGNYGTITFKNGHLSDIKVDDIYNIDGQLKEIIQPPAELTTKLGVKQLFLRDSNWSADNEVNSQTAKDFFKKETGQDVDGVITIDLSFIQNLLDATGPIKPAGYNESITSKNIFERGEYYAEIGFTPGSSQKREFFAALTSALITKITSTLNGQNSQDVSVINLMDKIAQSLAEKHLMLSFQNDQLAAYVKTKGFNRPLPPANFDPTNDSYETRDFLSLSEANLGANKVNHQIDRKITYEMTIGRDADLVVHLKITYTNRAQANTWPVGTYVNFLKVYTPQNSSIFAYKNGDSQNLSDVQSTTVGNLNIFSTFVEVPIKSSKTVEFTYRIPKNIKVEKAPTYHLYVEKQAGTDKDPFIFSFNLPGYLIAKDLNGTDQNNKQNISLQTDLSTDRDFTISVSKK